MFTKKKTVKVGDRPPDNVLRLRASPLEEHRKWVADELDNYIVTIEYLAFFFVMRSRLGDMTEQEVWDEIKQNISITIRGDAAGPKLQ